MNIQSMVEEGLCLVRADPTQYLSVGFRCRLLSSFDDEHGNVGRRWRTKLAGLAVGKVLPIWETSFPDDPTPQVALDIAQKLLDGMVSAVFAKAELDRLWSHCDELSWNDAGKQPAIMVGYGAIQVAREALSERHFGCEAVSDESTERDVGPYDHDSSFCAMIAYCGGPAWDTNSDAQKRLDFWVWWLTSVLHASI